MTSRAIITVVSCGTRKVCGACSVYYTHNSDEVGLCHGAQLSFCAPKSLKVVGLAKKIKNVQTKIFYKFNCGLGHVAMCPHEGDNAAKA